jgi:hypothetical protein
MVKFFAVVVFLVVASATAEALPVERFTGPIDLSCSRDDVCGFSARSDASLGGRLGISFAGGHRGGARLRSRGSTAQRMLEVSIPGAGIGALTLSWDGDSQPYQLSSGGLGCLNLRSDGAIAFRIEPFEVRASCDDQGSDELCQPITIESRVYDPSDPTGQRYAASILRRKVPRRGAALEIPFSNFIHPGPRGSASFECVGAMSVSIKVEGQRDLTLELGGIETVAAGPQLASKVTPVASTSVQASPTSTPRPTSTPTSLAIGTVVPKHTPSKSSTATPRPAKVASTPVPAPTKVAPPSSPPQQEDAPPLPTKAIEKVETPVPLQPTRESVFGAVIAPPAPATPTTAQRSRRRLWD